MASDRPQVKYRVDPGVKARFEEYVDAVDDTGQGRYGRHLERAMAQYAAEDRFVAIANRLDTIAEAVGAEKKKGKDALMADGRYHVPAGKNPGDVTARQDAVVAHIVDLAEDDRLPSDGYGPMVTQKVLMDRIETIAGVSTAKTQRKYLEAITSKHVFRNHPEDPGTWVVRV